MEGWLRGGGVSLYEVSENWNHYKKGGSNGIFMSRWFKTHLTESNVTPEEIWINRRRFIRGAGAIALLPALAACDGEEEAQAEARGDNLLKPTPLEDITSYNNFTEFGSGKKAPSMYARGLTTDPWHITIDGLVDKPGKYALDDLLKQVEVEERIYRFRCVEAWSMVVPWSGFMLRDLLKLVGVRAGAKFVAFETLHRPKEMPGQKSPLYDWPYREGLRLDEAMHPLTLMATGIYGKPMPKQNGAPVRLVVPWKYGFKSIKSVVRISLVEKQPPATWNMLQPDEYGFYANVNPDVSHPRWSQATERRLGEGLFGKRVPTLMFNGYEEEVAGLYEGMDLRKYY